MQIIPDITSSQTALNKPRKDSFGDLDQTDFLRLLTTQLRYQDPTAPTDPGQFMQQLVQFSSVDGIQSLQSTVSEALSSLNTSRLFQGTALVNKQVLAKTGLAEYQAEPLAGGVLVPEPSSGVRVHIEDDAGLPIRTLELGPGAGQLNFAWDGNGDNGQPVPAGVYRFTAEGEFPSGRKTLDTLLVARVGSISLLPGTGAVLAQLETGHSIPVDDIYSVF